MHVTLPGDHGRPPLPVRQSPPPTLAVYGGRRACRQSLFRTEREKNIQKVFFFPTNRARWADDGVSQWLNVTQSFLKINCETLASPNKCKQSVGLCSAGRWRRAGYKPRIKCDCGRALRCCTPCVFRPTMCAGY